MLKIDRHSYIEQELMFNGSILISSISKALHCSEETVRRDLKELESAGKLTRTQGGAYLMDRYDKSYPSKIRRDFLQDAKADMSRIALQYIKDNDVIMLDSSTTCLVLAEALIMNKLSVTVITNSLSICELCSERPSNLNIIALGGTFRQRSNSFVGSLALATLQHYYAEHAFISCPYVTLEHGLSDHNLDEAQVRELMLKNSGQRTLLMDHTKFSSSGNILFGDLSSVNRIITDAPLSQEWVTYCREHSIELEYNNDPAKATHKSHQQP